MDAGLRVFFMEASMQIEIIEGHEFPRVRVKPEVLFKISKLVDICRKEVSWFGLVEQLNGNIYYVYDIILFEQTVSSAETDIHPDAMGKVIEENGLFDKIDHLRLWGHSHVDMPVNPSVQDQIQALEFGEDGAPWMICTIHNKRGDTRIDFYDYEGGLAFKNIGWRMYDPDVNVDYLEAEVKEKVNELTVHYPVARYLQPKNRADAGSRSGRWGDWFMGNGADGEDWGTKTRVVGHGRGGAAQSGKSGVLVPARRKAKGRGAR